MIYQEVPEGLENFIKAITTNRKIHITVHDISGILKSDLMSLDNKYKSHPLPLCREAKNNPKGYNTCLEYKIRANEKAINLRKAYSGYCKFGIYEIVKPVIISNKVCCIISVGNMVKDREISYSKMIASCRKCSMDYESLSRHLDDCEYIDSDEEYFTIANLIDSYIKMLYEYEKSTPYKKHDSEYHWAISSILEYINVHFSENTTLESISDLFYMNPKYLGRLFKSETGCTFREYLNEIRIKNATNLLEQTDKPVVEIASMSGFQNVTYFNRIFQNKYNVTPTKYRANAKK